MTPSPPERTTSEAPPGPPVVPATADGRSAVATPGTPPALPSGSGVPGTPKTSTGEWVVELPAGMRLLSLNDRNHWAAKGRITRDLRKAAWACARNAGIPHLDRARVVVEYQPPLNGRHRDADNLAAAGKPVIDGALVDTRVLDSDDSRHLAEVTYRIGEPFPRGRLVLYVSEVTP